MATECPSNLEVLLGMQEALACTAVLSCSLLSKFGRSSLLLVIYPMLLEAWSTVGRFPSGRHWSKTPGMSEIFYFLNESERRLSSKGLEAFDQVTLGTTPIPGASLASTKEYISDPSRIVYACWDHDSITPMVDGIFRMGLKGQRFLTISIDMSVDIKFWAGPNGSVQCKSVGYSLADMGKILGQDFTKQFSFELEGELRVEETEMKVRGLALKNALLSGDVGLTISGKMPGPLAATPERLVKAACLGINNRVLGYVVRTFVDTVAGDYRKWARNLKDNATQ